MAYYNSGKSISYAPEADNSIINTLLYGIKWETSNIGTAINLTYSFPYTTSSTANWTSDYYYLNGEPYFTTSGLSSTQIIAAISAMQSWANVANITFTEVVENGDEVGDIRFAFSSAVEDAWGWSYLPNEYAFAGDIWISPDNDSDFSVGSYNYMALIHELGHSLGLKHPGYYGEGDEAPFLPYSTDNKQYSVMSYHDAFGNRMYENQPYYRYMWADEGTGYYVVPEAKTPMVYDILAMQYLYGANMSYHNTDDTYLFDENTAPFLMTIWDGGGNDTISVVGSVNSSIIDLNEGAYSVIQTSRFRGYDTISDKYVDNMYNLGIAYGAIIENAIGGEVNDTLTGNQVDNILEGRGGDDTIDGGAGNDTMDGGDGNDTASYQSSTAGVTVNLTTITAQNTIGAGTDTLTNIENLTGSKYNDILSGNSENNILNGGAGVDTISYKNSTAGVTVNLATITAQNTVGAGTDTLANFENLTGSDYNDILTGNSSNNVLEGGLGNDTLNGSTGIDTVTYESSTAGVVVNLSKTIAQDTIGAGTDIITAFENITGTNYNDILTGNSSANTINGNGGNDTLDGGAGNDVLNGGTGIDTVSYQSSTAGVTVNLTTIVAQNTIGAGTDTLTNFENLTGSNHNDTLTGDSGNNIIIGGTGDDIIDGGYGADTIDGGDGIDTLTYLSSLEAITVDLSNTSSLFDVDIVSNIESIAGSNYDDLFIGDTTNNILNGGAGVDTISYKNSTAGVTVNLATITAQNTVGAGTDTLANFENLTGSDYNDTITGNSSNNVLEGGLGNDIINGGTGIDTVTYENSTVGVSVNLTLTSAQTIQGTEKDTITGVENLTGTNYDDILTGNSSANTINGNGGNDTLDGGAGNDILNGGDGVDTLSYATATAAIKVNLSTTSAQVTGGSGTDTVSNFENLIGSKYNDTLTGNDSNNTIDGGVGNDIIEGGLGNDALDGGIGIDTLSYALSSFSVTVDLSNENAQDTIGAGSDTIIGFENLTGSNYDDTLKGNTLNNIILAGLGNDTLNGGLGNDTLDGGVGIDTVTYEDSTVGVSVNLALTTAQTIQGTEKDTIKNIENLTGSDYNDILKGSTLSNTINGLDGNDTIIAGTGKTNDIFDGGDGIDTISYEQATSLVTIDLSNTSSQVTTGSGSDTITNFENLTGSNYNDTLTGDNNNNTIIGGAGNDTINGNGGNDTLDGGAGNDIFIFDQVLSIDNIDTILNFSSVYDTIKIDDSIFDVFTNLGTILQSNLFSSIDGSASDGDDYILYNTTTGELSYDNDGSGSNAALVFATLGTTLHPTISYTDFVVI